MKRLNDFVVQFSELKEYNETLEFEIGGSFFEFFQSDEWKGGRLTANVEVLKRADGFTFNFSITGFLEVLCDRCLEYYAQPIEFLETLYIKFGETKEEIDDNMLVLPREENQVDISHNIYEYLVVSLPARRIHPEKVDGSTGCNEEMIEKLERHIVPDNVEKTDPRWDELKKLIDKN